MPCRRGIDVSSSCCACACSVVKAPLIIALFDEPVSAFLGCVVRVHPVIAFLNEPVSPFPGCAGFEWRQHQVVHSPGTGRNQSCTRHLESSPTVVPLALHALTTRQIVYCIYFHD